MTHEIEVIARGVLVCGDHVLLCRSRGSTNTYLPGGHVEFNESAKEALAREWKEELGVDAEVGAFLGAVEHTFVQKGERHNEVNLVFMCSAEGLSVEENPAACEERVTFCWWRQKELRDAHLEPGVLVDLIPAWLAEPHRRKHWGSTFPGAE